MPSRRSLPALAGFLALGLFWGAWAAVLPAVQRATGATKAELGTALLFGAVGSLPAMILTGRLIDRRGGRVLPVSLIVFGIAAALPGLAGSVPLLALGLVAAGAGSGAVDVGINTRVAALETETGARLMQFAHALYSIGVLVGSVGAGLARQSGAGREAILAAVGVALVATAILNLDERTPPPVGPRSPWSLSPALVALGLLGVIAFVFEGGVESWSALFLERELDAPAAGSGLGPGIFALAMALGRFSGQGIGGQIGDRTLLTCGALVGAAGAVLASIAQAVPVALAGFALCGGGIAVAAPVLFGAAGRGRPPGERGSAVATVTTIGYLAFLVGPPLMGVVSGVAGLRVGLLMLAGFALTLAATSRALPPR